jgi:hypothetical protein
MTTNPSNLSRFLLIACALALLSASHEASAQSLSIDWHTLGSGGGTGTNAEFSLSGTVGEPSASAEPITGGEFSLTGGFWSMIAVQTPDGPLLSIQQLGTGTRISWPMSGSAFLLEESLTPAGTWSPVDAPYTTNADDISITVTEPAGNKFFRLRKE